VTAIHQFVPSFAARDAIGAHTLQVRRLLHELGIESDVYADDAHPEVAHVARPYHDFPGGPATWLLYHASTGSRIARFLLTRPEPLVIDYHNITPARFFDPWEPDVAAELTVGWKQMGDLAARAVAGIGDSETNRRDLALLGYRETSVAPILLDLDEFAVEPDAATIERLEGCKRAGGVDWLFVGRLAPHKSQHAVVAAFAAFRRAYDPHARLHLVGGSASHAYLSALEAYIDSLGLGDVVELTGSISHEALAAHYDAADVFVCLSRHEGFCVPLLEAMHHRLPIVALGVTAVPETLAGAGLVVPNVQPSLVAAAVHRVLDDPNVRDSLVARGAERLVDFELTQTRAAWQTAIEAIVGAPA
jgi:glycosyltransferase involved in cell wall biosynthesis